MPRALVLLVALGLLAAGCGGGGGNDEASKPLTKAQYQAKREATLNIINQKIQSATTVDAVLQIAARELGSALGAPLTIAQLGLKNRSNGNS